MELPLKIGMEATIKGGIYTIKEKNTYTGFFQKKYYTKEADEDGNYLTKDQGEQGNFDVWKIENNENKLELWHIYRHFWLVEQENEKEWLKDKIEHAKQALQYQDAAQVMINLDYLHHIVETVAIGAGSLENNQRNETQKEIRFVQMIFNENNNYLFLSNQNDFENIEVLNVTQLRIENVLDFFKTAKEILPIQQNLSRLKIARNINLIFILLTFCGWFLGIILDKNEIFSHSFEARNLKDTTLNYVSKDFYLPQGNYLLEISKGIEVSSNNPNSYIKMPYEVGVDSYTNLYLYEDEPPLHEFVGDAWQSLEFEEGQAYYDSKSISSEYIYMPKTDTLFADIDLREDNNSSYTIDKVNVTFTVREAGFIWYNYLFMMIFFSVVGLIIEAIIYEYRK
ncbi:MAG: hypothetical protein EAY69_00365 [Cytophagales bacterium]|nr:MAG: hypothetical protein EAY69_00365 [Cytophagales bacterium]